MGKDVVARFIHGQSSRKAAPFVAVNCAGLTETLLESELFGHVKGSFTGAYRDKKGEIQLAHRGTLFLDEVGEMSLRMQALLLRFLETEVQAVGSDLPQSRVDVRVVAATNRNLAEQVAAGQFREDLLCIACGSSICTCRPCVVSKMSRRSGATFSVAPGVRCASPTRASRSCGTAGRATCANCSNVVEQLAWLSTDGVVEIEHLPDRCGPGPPR